MPPSTIVLMVLAPRFSAMKRGEAGDRDGEQDRDRRPHIAEKEQDHQRRQTETDGSFVDDILDGNLHEDGLIEDDVGFQTCGDIEQMVTALRMPLTMLIVLEPPPCLRTGI